MIQKILFRTSLSAALMLLTHAGIETAAGGAVVSACFFIFLELSILARHPAAELIFLAVPFGMACRMLCLSHAAPERFWLWLLLIIFTLYDMYWRGKSEASEREIRRMRDQSAETSQKLMRSGKRLRDEQDREIRLATLSERNRIARDIHDNVGHMLSRAIVLLGAVRTVNRDPGIAGHLDTLADTLDGAMEEMRSSVHDLRDESVDLRKHIDDIAARLKPRFRVTEDLDLEENLDARMILTLIAVCREAVSNIIRHSNGDAVLIAVHEHPGFVSLMVRDNGSVPDSVKRMLERGEDSGIGLSNITERVRELGGTADLSAEEGFRVFVNLPKRKGMERTARS